MPTRQAMVMADGSRGQAPRPADVREGSRLPVVLVGEDRHRMTRAGVESGDEAALRAARHLVALEPGGRLRHEDVVAGDAARLDQDVAVFRPAAGPQGGHHLLGPPVAVLTESHPQRLDQGRETDPPAKRGGAVDGNGH
jgi:hypothetical protein